MTINGNFTDANGDPVNIADLIRGTSQAASGQNKMSTISGWVYDGDGNPVNIVDIIRQADSTDVKGVKVNSGEVITPDENGMVNITISGDGQPVQLTTSEKNQLIGLLN